MKSSTMNLFDRIVLAQLDSLRDDKITIKPYSSGWINEKEADGLANDRCYAWHFNPFKDNFYLMISPEKYKIGVLETTLLNENMAENPFDFFAIREIFYPVFQKLQKFMCEIALKEYEIDLEEEDSLSIKEIVKNCAVKKGFPAGYLIHAYYHYGDAAFGFRLFFPIKLVRNIIYILIAQDFLKMSSMDPVNKLMNNLEKEFVGYRQMYPFNTRNFFESLDKLEFQKIISLLFSSNLITNDMLFALSRSIKDGEERIGSSISKNLQAEFIDNTEDRPELKEQRWIDLSLFQIMLNIVFLLENKKFESTNLSNCKKILEDVKLDYIQSFFEKRSFDSWMKDCAESKLFYEVVLKTDGLKLAWAFLSEENKLFELLKGNISKRKYEMLQEDIKYLRTGLNSRIEQFAKYDITMQYARALFFKTITEEDRDIELWIFRFKTVYDFNYVFNKIGTIDAALALKDQSEKVKGYIVKNLRGSFKIFMEDFFAGVLRLNLVYGKSRIEAAKENLLTTIFLTELFNEISLKPMEEIKDKLENQKNMKKESQVS